jgi:antagonist of KipI
VGNAPAAAALEITFPGPRLRVLDEVVVAVAGADLDARLNRTPLDPGAPARARRGDVLSFEAPRRGQWAYVAVEDGVEVPVVFGSRSTYARGGLGGYMGRALRAGDLLGRGEGGRGPGREVRVRAPAARSGRVRVITGPQADRLTVEAVAALLGQPFEVTARRDRSGVRLSGCRLGHRGSAEILSDGLLPGSVQVPADGAPIVILADGPTTGGYPRIACVIAADLDVVAQAAPGERLRFEAVSVGAAHDAWRSAVASWAGTVQDGGEVWGCS